MLLIDDEKVSREEFCKRLGINLDKLKKSSVFELHKSLITKDVANGGGLKINAANSIPCSFKIWDESGNEIKITYRTALKPGKNGNTPVSMPRTMTLNKSINLGSGSSSTKFSHSGDLDKGVYLMAYPANSLSPVKSQALLKTPIMYSYVDNQARALAESIDMDVQTKAMNHSAALDEVTAVTLAKGFGLMVGDGIDPTLAKSKVRMYARDNSKEYLHAVDRDVVYVTGQIQNLIDSRVIVEDNQYGTRQWKWAKGVKTGETIGEPILNQTTNGIEYVKSYILSNLQTYYSHLTSVSEAISAQAKAEQDLQKIKEESGIVGSDLPDFLKRKKNEDERELPKDFQQAKDYIEALGFKKLPANVKALLEAVTSGQITTLEQADTYVKKLNEQD